MLQTLRTKLSLAARRLTAARTARRLLHQQDGAAAVEFALVAAPFLALTFAIMETALVFFAGQTLETAVADAGRLIMTGQAQNQGFDQTAFKNAVCARIYGLFNCASGLSLDVKTYPSFSNISISNPIDANGNFQSTNFGYQPGGPSDIVVVRIFYQWPVYVSLLGFNLSDLSGGKRLLAGTSVFRNEPYTSTN